MEQSVYDLIDTYCKTLKVDLSSAEMATFTENHSLTKEQITAISKLFQYLGEKKRQTIIDTLLKLSRLPLKVPKTFEGYDFSRIHGKVVLASMLSVGAPL